MYRFLTKAVYGIYAVMTAVILALLVLMGGRVWYARINSDITVPNIILFVLAAALLGGLCLLAGRKKGAGPLPGPDTETGEKKRFYAVLAVLSAVLLVMQLVLCRNIYFLTGWDAEDARHAVEQLNTGGAITRTEPFDRYPNNIFIVFVLSSIWRAASALGADPNFAYLVVECVLVNGAVLLSALVIYALTENRTAALAGYGLAAASYGLSPWITIPYSDGYAVVFPVLSLFLYIKAKKWRIPVLFRQLLVLLPAGIGVLIKPQCIIVLIAIVIAELLEALRPGGRAFSKTLRLAALGACAAAAVCLCTAGLSAAGERSTGLRENEDVEMIPLHFVMMGLDPATNGSYSPYDVDMVQAAGGREAKTALCKQVIAERLRDMGPAGLMKHLAMKTLINFNDGTFAWNREGGFYQTVLDPPWGALSETMRSFYYQDGAHYGFFNDVEQFLWLFTLLAGLCGGICALLSDEEQDSAHLTVVLSLIGLALFVTIFEARARYLFLYAPFYTILSVLGVGALRERVARRRSGKAAAAVS